MYIEGENMKNLSMYLLLIFLILYILKLPHLIDWSWWIIFSPLWAPIVITIIIFTVKDKVLKK